MTGKLFLTQKNASEIEFFYNRCRRLVWEKSARCTCVAGIGPKQ